MKIRGVVSSVVGHDVTLAGEQRSLRIFNTGDTANGEWMDVRWESNDAVMRTNAAGSGTLRTLRIMYPGSSSAVIFVNTTVNQGLLLAGANTSTANTNGRVVIVGSVTAAAGSTTATSGTSLSLLIDEAFSPTATSTMVAVPLKIAPTINYSNGTPGAGSYEALKIAVVETALPTGQSYLIRASTGVAGATDAFRVTRDPWLLLAETPTNPGTGVLTADADIAFYTKADKLVFAYNNGGTMTYLTLPLDGSTTTWTHSTSAP